MANHNKPQIAVVIVPLPAQGHLNQLLHLTRLISSSAAAADTPIYYTAAAVHIRQAKTRVHGWDPSFISNVYFHELPIPTFDTYNPPPDPYAPTKFPTQLVPSITATTNFRDPVFAFVKKLSTNYRRVIVIYDSLMAYVVQDVDSIANAESYCFQSVSAFTIYSFIWDAAGKPDLPPQAEILKQIPGPDGFFAPEFEEFADLQRDSNSKKIVAGDIYNSSRVIEGVYLDLLEQGKMTGAEHLWAVGPFNPIVITKDSKTRHKCLEWLDKQGPNEVIFVSFGSTSSFSGEEVQELALGLERSNQKFIWVVRDADKGDIFSGEARRAELPKGFEERVSGRGIIVRDWAPQLEILSHGSTGGFMSHCGWNSCMESISMGVPIAAWPMHSDQPRNAFLVTGVLRIGVEFKDWSRRDEVVSSGTVENVVRRLMASDEGDEIRTRANELGVAVKNSLMMEGGSSNKEMDSFIAHITR